MRKTFSIIAFAVIFLLFIQMGGTLVSSIYTLDLLNTSLDAKVLGVLFFFFPVIFYLFRKPIPRWMNLLYIIGLFVARGLLASLDTNGKLLASGLGTAFSLGLFPYLVKLGKSEKFPGNQSGVASFGLSLALITSVMLRSIYYGFDYSLTENGFWIGWVLGIIFVTTYVLIERSNVEIEEPSENTNEKAGGVTSSLLGIFMVLTLAYFIFAAPGVLARWTEGNYTVVILLVSILSIGWFLVRMLFSSTIHRISREFIIGWNILFSASLIMTILVNRINFPSAVASDSVTVLNPSFWQQIPLYLMLIFFPVIYIDMDNLWQQLSDSDPSPRMMAPGMMLGLVTLVILVFMFIFTNVWGYVEPVSPFFRNKFYLPFLIITLILCLVVVINKKNVKEQTNQRGSVSVFLASLLLVMLVLTFGGLFHKTNLPAKTFAENSIKVMTYNVQQGNDIYGEQSWQRQLAIIQQVSPDILVLQESDSTRISLNNIDLVRYFADNLGFYSYYGPKTISGSYGTAILSRYPLEDTQSIFTFSDQDENGTAYARVVIEGKVFNIYDVHPDGSDDAKKAFAEMLLDRTSGQENVIIMGDFNLRQNEVAYQMIDAVFTNAWISIYPSGIGSDGLDMSGRNRIDHIFISSNLSARNPLYVLPPESATDHPVHWTEIYWQN